MSEIVNKRSKTPEQALSYLMRYASKAERSSGDALRLMRRWGIADNDCREILLKLKEARFIDDRRFAEAFVNDKSKFAGWGVYKIKSGLLSKGISKDIVDSALKNIDTQESNDKLIDILARKNRSLSSGSDYERKGKLLRYGMSRGFEYEAVITAIEKVYLKE